MRLAVLGTSNSIGPAGYVRGLTASGLFSAIDNYSLGASTTVAFPFSLSRFNPSSYDACIFDFAVNEEILLHNHPSAAIEIEARLLGVLEHFCDSNCLPIFFGPTKSICFGEQSIGA